MAKQEGVIQIMGTIDGLNFYRLNGENIVRMAGGGFNGEAIKNSPTMARVRDNMSEFGMLSQVNKHLRHALHPFYVFHKDGSLGPRIQQLLCKIRDLDEVSVRGQRQAGIGFRTPMGQHLFERFAFTPHSTIDLAFEETFDWDELVYTMSGIDTEKIKFPEGATHIAIAPAVLRIDFDLPRAVLYTGETVFIGRDFDADTIGFAPVNVPDGHGSLVALRCVRFYQELGGVMYVLKDKGLLGIGVLGVRSAGN